MACFGGLWIGLSIVFGCIVLGFGAQVYYLLWRKKRRIAIVTPSPEAESPAYTHYAKELLVQLVWWKKPSPESKNPIPNCPADGIPGSDDPEIGIVGKDCVVKEFGSEESVESELMRIHNLSGPPRFLFTIKEETREDLESDDGRSRKGSRARSLSDLILALDTPFLTPLPSPPLKQYPLNPGPLLDSYNNPLFESSVSVRPSSSPPPTFKFLRDAEEKLHRRLKEEAEAKLREIQAQKVTALTSSSQVLPVESWPTALRPASDQKTLGR